jgi:L-aminopeptidase/D-esterase-like protein
MKGGLKIKTNDTMELIPKLSKNNNEIIIDFDDILFSNVEYSEGPVGLIYIHFKNSVRCNMDIRGGWPAYTNCLANTDKNMIDGICITGGSMLGLESGSGIIAESLKKNNYKKWIGVNTSVIYSQNLFKNKIYSDKNLGRFAYNNLNNILYSGKVGAGVSARHGQGCAFYKLKNKIKVLALVVNNAIGGVYIDNILIKEGIKTKNVELGTNTTIIVLITNLNLDMDELKQLSNQVNVTIGESIKPFNTFFDGDTFYSCSTMTVEKPKTYTKSYKLMKFFIKCAECLKEAIHNSILDDSK